MLKKVIIGDLGEIYTGNTPSKKNDEYYESNDIMFIKPDIMSFDIKKVKLSNEYISEKARAKARIVPKNSLLVSCIGNIGKLAINEEEASFNQQINAIVHNNRIISSTYLAYLLKYNQKKLEAIANAPVVPIINKTQFSNFEVYIHESLEEQKKIVEVLDKAQELIDKRKDQIEALDELVKSRFIEMFGNPLTNSKGLKVKNFEEVVRLQRGFDLPTYERDENGVYNVWGANGILSKHSIYKVNEPGVITGRSGSLGKVYYTNEPYWPLNTTLFSKNTFGNNVVYLSYLLNFYKLERFSNGTGVPTLNRNLLDGEKIIDVPLELQNEFADFVKQVDKLKLEIENSLKELEDNFNSLMQKAFKGELF